LVSEQSSFWRMQGTRTRCNKSSMSGLVGIARERR
jgi:hypothetical protein